MPTAPAEKIHFGLKNVHYAVMEANGSYGTPVRIPGAVSLNLEKEGEMQKFYADDVAYWVSNSNSGYSGSIEVAHIPDSMYTDVWGYSLGSTDKVLSENANVEPKTVALLYQISNDKKANLFALYACTISRPGIGSKTREANIEPNTYTCDIVVAPLASGYVYSRTTQDTPDTVRNSWFTSVHPAPADDEESGG